METVRSSVLWRTERDPPQGWARGRLSLGRGQGWGQPPAQLTLKYWSCLQSASPELRAPLGAASGTAGTDRKSPRCCPGRMEGSRSTPGKVTPRKAPPVVLSRSSPCCRAGVLPAHGWHCLRPLLPQEGTGKQQCPQVLPGGDPGQPAPPRAAWGTAGLFLLCAQFLPSTVQGSRRCPLGTVTPCTRATCSSLHIQLAQGCPCGSAPALARAPSPSPCVPSPSSPTSTFLIPTVELGPPWLWPCCRDFPWLLPALVLSLSQHTPGRRSSGAGAEIPLFSPVRFCCPSSCQTLLSDPPVSPPQIPLPTQDPIPPHSLSHPPKLPSLCLLAKSKHLHSPNLLQPTPVPHPGATIPIWEGLQELLCSPELQGLCSPGDPTGCFLVLLVPHRAGREQNTSSSSSGQPWCLWCSALPTLTPRVPPSLPWPLQVLQGKGLFQGCCGTTLVTHLCPISQDSSWHQECVGARSLQPPCPCHIF